MKELEAYPLQARQVTFAGRAEIAVYFTVVRRVVNVEI